MNTTQATSGVFVKFGMPTAVKLSDKLHQANIIGVRLSDDDDFYWQVDEQQTKSDTTWTTIHCCMNDSKRVVRTKLLLSMIEQAKEDFAIIEGLFTGTRSCYP